MVKIYKYCFYLSCSDELWDKWIHKTPVTGLQGLPPVNAINMTAFHGKRHKNHSRSLVGFVCDRQNRKKLFTDISGTDLSDGHVCHVAGGERYDIYAA